MPDRENVIRDLRYIKSFGRVSNNPQLTEIAESALAILKEQNTRRCGKWKTIPYKKARVCSVCEKDEPYKFADDDADVYEYCPHCGAKMEGR